jgi:hypothetical protein
LNPFGVPGYEMLLATPIFIGVAIKLESLRDSYTEGLKLSAYDGVSLGVKLTHIVQSQFKSWLIKLNVIPKGLKLNSPA